MKLKKVIKEMRKSLLIKEFFSILIAAVGLIAVLVLGDMFILGEISWVKLRFLIFIGGIMLGLCWFVFDEDDG